jgi:hypothetical protein
VAGPDRQRPELVEGEAPVREPGRDLLYPVELDLEVGVVGGLPGAGALEGDSMGVQELAQPFPSDPDLALAASGEVVGEFADAPAGERAPELGRARSGRLDDERDVIQDGTLALRFDWNEPPPGSPKATLTLQKIDLDQTPRDLVDPNAPGGPQRLDSGKLYELSLAAVQKLNGPLNPGERLRLVLHVDSGPVKPVVAQLDITIVEAPVIPTTEAAYALLRRQTAGDHTYVECVRFAWGPEAQRVELVNPADLRTEVVRRRAVFQFTDSTRPERAESYTVQKISQTGSTHIPL